MKEFKEQRRKAGEDQTLEILKEMEPYINAYIELFITVIPIRIHTTAKIVIMMVPLRFQRNIELTVLGQEGTLKARKNKHLLSCCKVSVDSL